MLVSSALPNPWSLRALPSPEHGGPGPAQPAGTVFAAQVPGCVHTDLLAADALPDPYLDANEYEVAWVGRTDWEYTTVLPRSGHAHERTDLVFEGLDTFADVSVGGAPIGSTANMHRSYRFDVTGPLADADAELRVAFTSAHRVAEALRDELGPRPNAYPQPFNYVRKMACSFGWDWGPTLVTAGIWRPVRLEHWSTARLSGVAPAVTVSGGDGTVTADVTVERTAAGADRPLRLRATVTARGTGTGTGTGTATGTGSRAGTGTHLATGAVRHDEPPASGDAPGGTPLVVAETAVPPGADAGSVTAHVPAPDLWWPHTLGTPHLYDLRVELQDAESGQVLDRWERGIGFRTVELDTAPDEHGSAFRFTVNGVPVFARGVNWIPDDALPSRITPERYRTRLRQAAAAHVDLVRVWGGGIYEDEAFYAACDELGLMVWQDFPFACAAYPEEGPLPAEIEAEARENVVRLMPHPSLVLWNGNNENLWGHEDWDWKEPLAGASWGRGYYLDLLPRIVAELDPTRPYWPGSPWSGSADLHPNDPAHGTTHLWEEWNRRPYSGYLAGVPRFVAEFGWQAPPARATVERSVSDRPLTADSPGMLHHQKAEDGNGKLARGMAADFAVPDTFGTWHYLAQLTQARAVATGIEHWRANWPLCAGTVVWQLNDCWPVTSWAAIDGDGRLKPLWYELRRVYADRLLTFEPPAAGADRDGNAIANGNGNGNPNADGSDDAAAGRSAPRGLELAAVNQSGTRWQAAVDLLRVRADGTVAARARVALAVEPRSVARIPVPRALVEDADAAKEFWVADCAGLRAVHFAAPDKDFAYPAADYGIDVEVTDEGRADGSTAAGVVRVTVTARGVVRDLLLQADLLHPDAVTDTGRVTLLPGESVTHTVTGWPSPDPSAVPAALFCVNSASGPHVR